MYQHSSINFFIDHELNFTLYVLVELLKDQFGPSLKSFSNFIVYAIINCFEAFFHLHFSIRLLEEGVVQTGNNGIVNVVV